MVLKTIIFKRKKGAKTEIGFEFEGRAIIDKNGHVVPAPIYNAKDILGIQLDLFPLIRDLSKTKWNF